MLVNDLIRNLNNIKKKNPNTPVFIFGDTGDLEKIKHVVLCHAPHDLVQESKVTSNDCQKEIFEGSVPVVVLG